MTTIALTAQERTRRYRNRQREMRDPVRSFLTGVVESAEDAVRAASPHEGDEQGTKYPAVEPWQLARADTARDLLDRLDLSIASTRPRLTWRLLGRSDAETEALYQQQERNFERWRLEPGNVPKTAREDAPALSLAETGLSWAAGLLEEGKATSPSLAQGLRSAARLIAHRQRPVVVEAAAEFALLTNVRDQRDLAERGWILRPTADYLTDGATVAREETTDDATED